MSTGADIGADSRCLLSAFLEHVPDYVYFKDRDSRFIAVSRSLVRHLGCTSAGEVLGRTDFDFFSGPGAQARFDDEQRVIATGQPLLNQLECGTRSNGGMAWAVTSKLPLRDDHGAIIGTFGISKDITATKQIEQDLEQAHKDLVEASRVAGMAEVATGVLHNVGNVLISLNVSANVISAALRHSKVDRLAKLAELLREHQGELAHFLTHDAKGRRVPEFLASLAQHALEERARLLQEVASLQKNIDHIKEIVSMQQAYATMIGVTESLDPAMLMEDALRMNAGALERHDVRVERKFEFVPAVLGEKAKVLQILVNLIRNAKYACDESTASDRLITLRVEADLARDRVRLIVQDNGVGIPAENLTRIFQHGFTTRAHGHGFGLHSAANAAHAMKGALTVHSAGPGCGATFTLELPVAPPAIPTE